MSGAVPNFINLIPNTPVDDFFFFGFIGGIVSYAYYLFLNRNEKTNQSMGLMIGIYGTLLSGCIGGLLAVVFDRAIELSIIVGLLNQIIYMALVKSAKNDHFWQILRDILIKFLTVGKAP